MIKCWKETKTSDSIKAVYSKGVFTWQHTPHAKQKVDGKGDANKSRWNEKHILKSTHQIDTLCVGN